MEHSFAPRGIDIGTAERTASILQDRLIGLLDLSMTLKHAHWNVVGKGFLTVHEMFDEHVAATRRMADELAERIATLGGIPNGLPGFMTSNRSWNDYELGRGPVDAHLGALDMLYSDRIGEHRASIGATEELEPVTADMLTTQTAELEKLQWFVRAHLQNIAGELPTTGTDDQLDAAASAVVAGTL